MPPTMEILNDLSTRFLIHLPPGEKKDPTRLCFQMELAYWFYLDYYAGDGSGLPNLSMRDFTHALFAHIPGLRKYSKRTDDIIATWKQFKFAVPTFGCILVDDSLEQILLVQGYWSKGSWGFPKGKINENEKPHKCAAREVQEETGFDCSHMINKKVFLERRVGDHDQRLYIVHGVSRNTVFLPQTKKEIRSIRWFHLRDLPSFKKDPTPTERLGINSNAFFMIMPFVKPLRKMLNQLRQATGKSPLPMLKTPKPASEAGSIPKSKTGPSSVSGDSSTQLSNKINKQQNHRDAQSSTTGSRRSSVEHHARRSLSKLFDEAAKLQDVGDQFTITNNHGIMVNKNTSNSNHNVNNNNHVNNNVGGKGGKHNKSAKQGKRSAGVGSAGGSTESGRTAGNTYKPPNFDIPAWKNFKLDYDEYAKLVY
ncbi:m7GpppN-mRNA hydrolase-like isoform X2 [Varroa jacobsoni]|uniref:m7GpppN-mRNA hydrolase-like isoform X2 n=1 Tax=Varroa jacobsoni TaxID=62625 RepID=UPI000BF9BA09|nr:m7GpppN-mRNA hydrolase-like isoform X2 [Varroa jacobsoni]